MKMSVDFNREVDRRSTSDVKWRPEGLKGYLPIEVSENEIPMWIADMDFACPECIVRAIKERADKEIFGYCSYKQEYYDALTWWFDKRFGMKIHTDLVSMMPTVVSAINVAIRAFSNPGDKVIIQQPVYDPFAELIKKTGRVMVNNGLICNDGLYEMDFPLLEEQAADPDAKIMILCSPHNPVGRVWTKEELTRLGDICVKHHVTVVSDEIHEDFVFKGKHQVFANIKKEYEEITVTCTAPSKTFNIASLMISNILIPNPELKRKFKHQMDAAGISQLNVLGLVACESAYEHGEEWYQAMKNYVKENIEFVKQYVEKQLPGVNMVEHEGTYLVWLDFRGTGLRVEELDDKIINQAKLWLDSGKIFGSCGEGFQRINVACPRKVLEEAMERIKKVVG